MLLFISVKWVFRVSAAAGAITAPILFVSVRPISMAFPMVALSILMLVASLVISVDTAAVVVNVVVCFLTAPYSTG